MFQSTALIRSSVVSNKVLLSEIEFANSSVLLPSLFKSYLLNSSSILCLSSMFASSVPSSIFWPSVIKKSITSFGFEYVSLSKPVISEINLPKPLAKDLSWGFDKSIWLTLSIKPAIISFDLNSPFSDSTRCDLSKPNISA